MTNGTTELFCKEKSLYIVRINAVSILLWSLSGVTVFLQSHIYTARQIITNMQKTLHGWFCLAVLLSRVVFDIAKVDDIAKVEGCWEFTFIGWKNRSRKYQDEVLCFIYSPVSI